MAEQNNQPDGFRAARSSRRLSHTLGYMKKVLFICSQNQLRSPTAEQVFSTWMGLEVSSAGTNHDAENPVTPEALEWADIIIVMERAHRNKLQKKFRSSLNGKRIVCLEIPDEYDFMDPSLIRLLEAKVPQFLPAGAFNGT